MERATYNMLCLSESTRYSFDSLDSLGSIRNKDEELLLDDITRTRIMI